MTCDTVWICGSKGMLGQALVEAFGQTQAKVVATDLGELDLTQGVEVMHFARTRRPGLIVNAAAYTAVDQAEQAYDKALSLNRDLPENLARASGSIGATLIHISTDYVFSGEGTRPWREEDPVAPLSRYGQSKAAGELAVRSLDPQALIFRISWLYGPHTTLHFPGKILERARAGQPLRVVDDQWGAPTYAPFFATALADLFQRAQPPPGGIYHWSDEGCLSWHLFAQAILEGARARGLLERPFSLSPLTSAELKTPAPRPANSRLDLSRVRRVLRLSPRPWREGLEHWLDRITHPQEFIT